MERTLQSLAEYVQGSLIGDGSVRIRNINAVDAVQEGELTFAENDRRLEQALGSKAAAIIVTASVTSLRGRSGISVKDPKLAFALLLELFHPELAATGAVHPTAVISATATLAEQVDVRAHALIGEHTRIGHGSIIESGAILGDDVTIGEQCLIGPNVIVYRQSLIGDRVRIHGGSVIGGDGFGYIFHEGRYVKVPQVGNVVIEDDVELGCNVCVDRATIGSTIIQRGTKVDNLVQIAHNDRIGRHVIMAGQAGLSGSVTVGDYVRMGGKAGVIDHIDIGPQAEIGAASVVTKNVPPKTKMWGYPARPVTSTLQQLAALSRLPAMIKKLTQALQRLTRLERRLDHLDPPSKP